MVESSIGFCLKTTSLVIAVLAMSVCAPQAFRAQARTGLELPHTIVLSPTCVGIESFAATELQAYLQRLYGWKARVARTKSGEGLAGNSFLIVGRPADFPLVRDLTQSVDWSQSDQTYTLIPSQMHGKRALVVAGASAPAVLWAAYELIESWGVRFDLDGDLLPVRPAASLWPRSSIVRRPAIPMRVLTGHNLHVEGPASWGFADYRKFLDQAAKLRYNGYMFMLRDIGPWFDLEFRGIRKTKADIYGGGWQKPYRIAPELIGYRHFKREGQFFYNDWFRHFKTDAQRMAAGPRLVAAIFEHARKRGMKTGVYFELANLPPEMKEGFAKLSGSSGAYEGIPENERYLKSKERVTDALLWDLIETKLRKIQETYPNLDFYEFGQMEHTSATASYLPLWQELDRKYGVASGLSLEEVLRHADRYPVRRSYAENVAGEVEFLWLIDKIFLERQALGRIFPASSQLLVGNGVTTLEFFPILPRIWPPQIQLAAWLEYGYHRAAQKLEVLGSLAQHKARAWVNNCLDEDNNLWLAQNAVESIHATIQKAVAANIEGMEVGHWRVRDVAPAARFMAEACWNPALTPESFYRDCLGSRVGEAAAGIMEQGFRKLEQADRYASVELLGIAFCYPGRLRPYLTRPEKQNERKHQESLRLYSEAWQLFESALTVASPPGRAFTQAWTNRVDFSRRYLRMLLLARELGMVLKHRTAADRLTPAAGQLARALVEHVRQMLELVASDVRDRSDQGTLINLNYLLYQPALEIQKEVAEDPGRSAALSSGGPQTTNPKTHQGQNQRKLHYSNRSCVFHPKSAALRSSRCKRQTPEKPAFRFHSDAVGMAA